MAGSSSTHGISPWPSERAHCLCHCGRPWTKHHARALLLTPSRKTPHPDEMQRGPGGHCAVAVMAQQVPLCESRFARTWTLRCNQPTEPANQSTSQHVWLQNASHPDARTSHAGARPGPCEIGVIPPASLWTGDPDPCPGPTCRPSTLCAQSAITFA